MSWPRLVALICSCRPALSAPPPPSSPPPPYSSFNPPPLSPDVVQTLLPEEETVSRSTLIAVISIASVASCCVIVLVCSIIDNWIRAKSNAVQPEGQPSAQEGKQSSDQCETERKEPPESKGSLEDDLPQPVPADPAQRMPVATSTHPTDEAKIKAEIEANRVLIAQLQASLDERLHTQRGTAASAPPTPMAGMINVPPTSCCTYPQAGVAGQPPRRLPPITVQVPSHPAAGIAQTPPRRN